VATFNCVGQTRSIIWSASQRTPSSRTFWSTSRGVYVVAAGAPTPSTNPTLLVSFLAIGLQNLYHVGAYEFNNRLYVWHGANRHFEFPNIPTAPINVSNVLVTSGGHRTTIAADGGRIASIMHIAYGTDPFGRVYSAGQTTGLRTWSRGSTAWSLVGSWTIPNCGSVRCFDFSRNAALQLPDPLQGVNYIIFGGTNGRLVFADTSDLQFVREPQVSFGGAGSVMTMRYAIFGGKQTLFYGTSLGLIFQYDLVSRRLINLVFVTSSASASVGILDLVWDQSNSALIASYGDGALAAGLARVTVSDGAMDILDTEMFPQLAGNLTTGSGRVMFYRPDLNRIFVGADQPVATSAVKYPWNLPSSIYSFSIASCSNYDCETCGYTDPSYCGYCPGTGTCELIAQLNSTSCPAGQGTFSKPAVCPYVTGLSIISGAASGGSSVVFQGRNFFAGTGAASLYSCDFGGSPGTVTSVSSTAITCRSPPGTVGTTIDVFLSFRGRLIKGEALEFTYVDCATQGCSTCFAVGSGDCNWCYRSGTCAAAGSCSGPFSGTSCPALLSVSNAISTTGFNNAFSLTVNDLPGAESYRCSIDAFTSAGSASGNILTCPRPSGVSPRTTTPIVEINDGGIWRRFTQPRSNDPTIEVYNCSSIGACFSCINSHPDCGFCTGTCSYDQASAGCSNSTSTCPIIVSANPSRLHYSADAGSTLTLTLTDPAQTAPPANFRCVWTNSSGSAFATTTALGASTALTVLCPVPAGNLTNPLSVEVRVLTTPHSNAFRVIVYDCSAGTTCSNCADAVLRPKCVWCNSLLACEATAALPGGLCPAGSSGSSACPTINISPDQDTTGGGNTIVITPSPFPPTAANAFCAFRGSFINAESPAVSNGTSFACTIPVAASAGNALVTLKIAGVDYASPVSFTFYDCTFASAGVYRNCSNCLSRLGCSWCGTTCGSTATCVAPLSVCPVITAITPDHADADNSDFISVAVTPYPPADFTYECVFGTVRAPATLEDSGLRCQTPIVGDSEMTPVRIGVQGVSSGFFTTDEVPKLVDFYRCNPASRQCGPSCFSSSPYCGYCMETGLCSGRTACARALSIRPELELDKIWFNSSTGCPLVSSYGPTYMQVRIPGRTPILEEFYFQLANVELPAINTTANKKRQTPLSDFSCSFGADESPINRFDPTNNTFFCTAPTLSDQGFYSLSVTFRGNRINSESPVRLQAQDCYSIPVCGLCVLQPNCGWCPGSVRCMTKAWCNAEPIPDFGPSCPSLSRVAPSSSVVTAEVDVTISGGPFVNSPELVVYLVYPNSNESFRLNTTWQSSSQLSVRIPPSIGEREGEVRLQLFINGTQYTPSELSFFYVSLASLQGVSPGTIGGISAAAIAVIVALVVALIIMKTRRVGFWAQFRLVEPNYEQVAFGTMLIPQWKAPKDNWEILAIKLLSKNTGFALAIMQTTPATDQDKIARALCHVYEWHRKSVEYGVLFVTEEVKRNLEENTIFRNNSMASKWFKFYSKIVGIKYLFDHLARFIFELNKISDLRNKTEAEASGGNSLLTLDMEVDPSKFGNDAFTDSEANVYQLILACQKVFTAFNKSVGAIPPEFKRVFQSMRESIVNKFKSDDAVLKAVGGFFFLRFSCPAITAPHAYGLLENPPNENAQRQLVLIGKVIQNLANMTMPGVKV
jgi:hypothetical protein